MVNLPKVLTKVARFSCTDRERILHFLSVAKGQCAKQKIRIDLIKVIIHSVEFCYRTIIT